MKQPFCSQTLGVPCIVLGRYDLGLVGCHPGIRQPSEPLAASLQSQECPLLQIQTPSLPSHSHLQSPPPSPPASPFSPEIRVLWRQGYLGTWQQLGQGSKASQTQATDVFCFVRNNRVIGGKLVQCEVPESSTRVVLGSLCLFSFHTGVLNPGQAPEQSSAGQMSQDESPTRTGRGLRMPLGDF